MVRALALAAVALAAGGLAACEIVDLVTPQRSPAAGVEIHMVDADQPIVQVRVDLATGFDARGRAHALDSAILRVNERVLTPERRIAQGSYEFLTTFDVSAIPDSVRIVLPRITGLPGHPPEVVVPVVRRPGPFPVSLEHGQDLQFTLPAVALPEPVTISWRFDLAAQCTPSKAPFMTITDLDPPPRSLVLPGALIAQLAPDPFEACFHLTATRQGPSSVYTLSIYVVQQAEYLVLRDLVRSAPSTLGGMKRW